jgi:hypothetical protein
MVLVSAADSNMPDVELTSIGDAVMHLPVFRDFDRQKPPKVAADCTCRCRTATAWTGLQGDQGSAAGEAARDRLCAGVRRRRRRRAVTQEEARILQMVRDHLLIGRLPAAAIERGARARHTHV